MHDRCIILPYCFAFVLLLYSLLAVAFLLNAPRYSVTLSLSLVVSGALSLGLLSHALIRSLCLLLLLLLPCNCIPVLFPLARLHECDYGCLCVFMLPSLHFNSVCVQNYATFTKRTLQKVEVNLQRERDPVERCSLQLLIMTCYRYRCHCLC